MIEIATMALSHWGMSGASCKLVSQRENQVFRVEFRESTFALRLHRAGYRSDSELRSELQWMDALAEAGLTVPTPIKSTDGQFLHLVEGAQVDILTWLPGIPLGSTGVAFERDMSREFHALGREIAKLHHASDNWIPPGGFSRCRWDRAGLVGASPLWGRFWENPTFSKEQADLFSAFGVTADADLLKNCIDCDFGLIHADLVRENVLVNQDQLALIDFDDGGFGYRLFDVATALVKNLDEPDYPRLRDAILAGYRELRPLDTSRLDLFLALRATTYVGWIVERINEPGAQKRNKRFLRTAERLVRDYLNTRG